MARTAAALDLPGTEQTRRLPETRTLTSIERGSLGEFTGALSAACLVLDRKLGLVLGVR